jgi:hypothetical protein
MLRIGLTLWFVLTTLAGPGLCCCSLQATVTHPTAAASVPTIRSCCHREPGPAESAPVAPPAQSPCPCKDDPTQPQAVRATGGVAAERGESRFLDDGSLPFFQSTALTMSGEGIGPITPEQHPGPFRTGRDILCAQHVLRC